MAIQRRSLAEILLRLPESDRVRALNLIPQDMARAAMLDATETWLLRQSQRLPTPVGQGWLTLAMISGRGSGKGLPVDTPIPTPYGWTAIGDLKDGDDVLDHVGQPSKVIKAHDPYIPDRLYLLTFEDGTVIKADAPHLWTVLLDTAGEFGSIWPFLPWAHTETTEGLIPILRQGSRIHIPAAQSGQDSHVLVDIEAAPTALVRCLTVDAPARLYLAGEAMIPTHNTHALSTICNSLARFTGTIGICGATADDTRRVLVESDSGIIARAPVDFMPEHRRHDRVLVYPNGAKAYLFSAERPDRIRGQNLGAFLADELAAWDDPEEAWTQAQLALRAGKYPINVVATTPRPIPLLRRIMADPTTFLVNESTDVNRRNLAATFLNEVVSRYEGTRVGRQELEGRLLNEVSFPLWPSTSFHYCEVAPDINMIRRVIIGVDPAVGGANADLCGICAAAEMADGTYLVLEDASCSGSPQVWAGAVARCFDRWRADKVVAEINNGGQLVVEVLRQAAPNLPVDVVHASRGKIVRAEPVSALYEQGRVRHLRPFRELEVQMSQMSLTEGYTGDGSPDRVEAMVWALTTLSAGRQKPTSASSPAMTRADPRIPT